MKPPNDHVTHSLRVVRRRLIAQRFVRALAICALIAGALLVLAAGIRHWALGMNAWEPRLAIGAAITAATVAIAITLIRRCGLDEVAATVDRLGGTRDRFVTALDFRRRAGNADELRTLAVREFDRFATGRNFRTLLPWRVPREGLWLVVPAVALAMLQWDSRIRQEQRETGRAEARAEVAETADELDRLARTVEKQSEQTQSKELKRIAEQLKTRAEQLRGEMTSREQAHKAALQKLSELEELVRASQQAPTQVPPDEIKALAKALENNEATRAAATAIQAGNMAEAAKQLETSAAEAGDDADAKREALREALEQVAEQRQLSAQMQQLANELQQRAGPGGKSSDALRQLAQILRQQQGRQAQEKSGSGGRQMTQQALQNLLSALQDLKFRDGQTAASASGAGQEGKGSGTVAVQSLAPGPSGEPMPASAHAAAGLAGSERDSGTTATALGDKVETAGEKGAEVALKGELGEGETLSSLMPSAGDTSRSNRRYKELYEAMAPAAEDAVVQENIPLGSRFFIKRYFEAIRPTE